MSMSIPYAGATTGRKAREEITKIRRRLGCESIGFMDDYSKAEVLLAFTHRGRQVQLRVAARGWAALYLKVEPWTYGRRGTRHDYEGPSTRPHRRQLDLEGLDQRIGHGDRGWHSELRSSVSTVHVSCRRSAAAGSCG
jgi:hypothetical protein